jgi:hypothetical protein
VRRLTDVALARYRLRSPEALAFLEGRPELQAGAFLLPSGLCVLASRDPGWEHVSASRRERCPTWPEMCHVKDLFFMAYEVVMQLHVADADHVSFHDHTLHLWRPTKGPIPLPPKFMVGPYPGWERDLEAAGLA